MSIWRRDIFKWPKRSQSAKPNISKPHEPLVTIGNLDETVDAVAKDLHSAAIHGRQRDIVKHLETGICIDFPNDAGQTPLFCAAVRGHSRAVEVLLQNGANPSEKDNRGLTPVHAACLRGSLRMLGAMIEYGGDLRLHDNDGHTCLDWAKRQPDPRRRLKMLEFLQKSQLFALNYSGDLTRHSTILDRQPSILQMLRSKVGSHMSLDIGSETGLKRVRSHGFGKVYYGGDSEGGILSVIPLITDNMLTYDDSGVVFDCTSHLLMVSMRWDMTPVTVKESSHLLHRENTVDLLISELERLSKLRHPNILLLMGLCQSTNLDNLMLVFERVSLGSLNYLLYNRMERLPMMTVRDIARQVCDAMLYIHHQNFLHCGLSSHAVFLVSVYQAKIGSFEYMVERKKAEVGRSSIVSSAQHKEQLYRWMAPEVLLNEPPSVVSDVYSFCCVLWEMVTSEMPWKSMCLDEVATLLKSRKGLLSTDKYKMPALFKGILDRGLKLSPSERPPDFVVLQQWLLGPIDKGPEWKSNSLDRLVSLQRESQERIRLPGYRHGDCHGCSDCENLCTSQSNTKPEKQGNSLQTEKGSMVGSHAEGASRPSSGATDDTNNAYNAYGARFESLHDSWSSLGDSESDDADGAVVKKSDSDKKKKQRRYWREMSDELRQSRDRLPRKQDPLSQAEISGLFLSSSQPYRQKRRQANLPWQGSLGLLRAGNTSPRLSRISKSERGRSTCLDAAAQEGDYRTLPPVKPASHSTDIKSFTRAFPTQYSSNRLKSKSLERSVSGHSPRSPRRTISRPRSEYDEVDELIPADMELKHQGSVRSLAEQFQAHVYNHSLRQSILRGSMNPQGLCEEGARLSPEQKLARIFENAMEKSRKEKRGSEEELDREEQGSAGSLTTVSARDSMTDDDLREEGKDTERDVITSRSHVTEEETVPMPRSTAKTEPLSKPSTSGGEFITASSDNSDMVGLKSSGVVMVGFEMIEASLQDYIHDKRDSRYEDITATDSVFYYQASDRRSHRKTRDELSPHSTDDDRTPRQTKDGRSSRHSRDVHSPQQIRDDLSPRHAKMRHSPRHTDDLSPSKSRDGRSSRQTKEDVSPRHTRDDCSSRFSRVSRSSRHSATEDISPRHTKAEISPRYIESETSPHHTRHDVPPRHIGSETSPHHTRDDGSRRQSRQHQSRDDVSRDYTGEDLSPHHIRGDHTGENRSPSHTNDTSHLNNRDELSPSHTRGENTKDTRLSRHCRDTSPRRTRRNSPRRTRDRSPKYFRGNSPDRAREDNSDKHIRDNNSPISDDNPSRHIKDNSHRRAADGKSPREVDYERSSRESNRNGESPRYGKDNQPSRCSEGTFDFEEYYIDDDYTATAVCDEEDPHIFGTIRTQGSSFYDVHITNNVLDEMDGAHRRQSKQHQASKTVHQSSQDSEGQYPSEDEKLEDERELQSASDTIDISQEEVAQRCILLSLERSGPEVDDPSQSENLENLSTRSLYGDEGDGVAEFEEHHVEDNASPPPKSTLRKFYLAPNTCLGGYTTTLRVESSLETLGTHHITHTARDEDTGVTHTVHEETVTASTLRTTLGVQ